MRAICTHKGSACLQGSKAKREDIKLDHAKFIKVLRALASKCQPDAALLRIYWYDGTSRGPTLDHRTLADLDDVKLRLGFINSVGQQKGVDSLLVTDLVELSRNGAICDALLLGGDEDLRIGVQIAQSFGVRVHLIGVEPSRASQSLQLRQEVDSKHEISGDQVKDFLGIAALAVIVQPAIPATTNPTLVVPVATVGQPTAVDASIDQGIDSVIARLTPAEFEDLKNSLASTRSVPALYDGRVLASCRTELGRELEIGERKLMRGRFIARIKAMQKS